MKQFYIIAIFLFLASYAFSQTIKCNDLYGFIIENGYKKATLNSFIMNSSWLNKVTAYTYDYKIYVVAEIKRDEMGLRTSTYIYCGIPSINWTSFQFGGYGDSDSYGERFHKYIKDYKCNCN